MDIIQQTKVPVGQKFDLERLVDPSSIGDEQKILGPGHNMAVEAAETMRLWKFVQMEDAKLIRKVQEVIESTETKITKILEKLEEENKQRAERGRKVKPRERAGHTKG